MPTYRGTWRAKVEQDFEIEARDREEAVRFLDEEMNPRNVVELFDFDTEWDEIEDEDEEEDDE